MIRKIIKQGHNTLTITLPTEWAKKFNLVAGSEIDVSERDNGLFISTQKNGKKKTAEFDISGMDIPTIWKYFMVVYREGYDEVIVRFNPEDEYESPYKFFTIHAIDIKYGNTKPREHTTVETIQEITNRFIGFEVVEHHKDFVVIKDMAELSSKEFDSSLRRVFLLIQQMAEEISEAIKTNKHETLRHTHDIDINVDKFHDYCIRVLNKTGFKETKKTNLLFSFLYLLEMLGDELKNIAFHIIDDMKNNSLDNLKQPGEIIIEQINKLYDLFYNFSKEKVVEMSKRDMEVYFYLPKIYKKKGNKSGLNNDELEILNHFRRITRYVNALVELRIEMEF